MYTNSVTGHRTGQNSFQCSEARLRSLRTRIRVRGGWEEGGPIADDATDSKSPHFFIAAVSCPSSPSLAVAPEISCGFEKRITGRQREDVRMSACGACGIRVCLPDSQLLPNVAGAESEIGISFHIASLQLIATFLAE
ncbi:hypothetical protein V9T40_006892 [Parthenolecanium corni]|uniref:Uncharacterized protein n=1 Tax=Parthenolecanium corni TaxID=536013 RepID=A0AAN9U230_9HEMI